jgi:hypothetical protein
MGWDFSFHAGRLRARALSIHAIVTFRMGKRRPSSIDRCGRQRIRRQARGGGIGVRRGKRHGNRVGIWSRIGTGLRENIGIGGAHSHRRGGGGRRLPRSLGQALTAGASYPNGPFSREQAFFLEYRRLWAVRLSGVQTGRPELLPARGSRRRAEICFRGGRAPRSMDR